MSYRLTGRIYRITHNSHAGPPVARKRSSLLLRKDMYFGGDGKIAGVVTVQDARAARRVRLFDQRTGILVRETWSSQTGNYEFRNIATGRKYLVIAHDHIEQYNAAVADLVEPDVMP